MGLGSSTFGGSTLTFGASTFPPILIPAFPFFEEELLLDDDEELDFFFPPMLILAFTLGGSTFAFGGSTFGFGSSTFGGSTFTFGGSTFPPILIPAFPFFDELLLDDDEELDFFFPPIFILASTFGGSIFAFGSSIFALGGSTLAFGGSILGTSTLAFGGSTFPPILSPTLPFFDDELLLEEDEELDFFFPPILTLASTLGSSTFGFGGSTFGLGGSTFGTSTFTFGGSTFPAILIPPFPFFDELLLDDEEELDFFFPPIFIFASTLGGSTFTLGGSTFGLGSSTFGLGSSTFPAILIPALPFFDELLLEDEEELDFFFPPILILASTFGSSTFAFGASILGFGSSTFPPILIPPLPFFDEELLEDEELDFCFPPILIFASTFGGSILAFGGSIFGLDISTFGGSTFTLGGSTFPPILIPAFPFFDELLLEDDEELDFFFPPMLILASTLGSSTLGLGGSTFGFGRSILGGSTLAFGGSTLPPILIPNFPFFDDELLEDEEELDFFFPPILIFASTLGGSTFTFGGSTFGLGSSTFGGSTFPPNLIPALPFFDDELLDDEELDFFFPPKLILASTFGGSTFTFGVSIFGLGASIFAFGGSTFPAILIPPLPFFDELLLEDEEELDFFFPPILTLASTLGFGRSIFGGSTLALGGSTFPAILIPALPFFDELLLEDEEELDFFFPPILILASTFGSSTFAFGASILGFGSSTFPPILIPPLPFFDEELLEDEELDFFFPPILIFASTFGGSILAFGVPAVIFAAGTLMLTFFLLDELLLEEELDFFPPTLTLASTLALGTSILGAATFMPPFTFLDEELDEDDFFLPKFIFAFTFPLGKSIFGDATLIFAFPEELLDEELLSFFPTPILGRSTLAFTFTFPFFLLEDELLDDSFFPILTFASMLGGLTLASALIAGTLTFFFLEELDELELLFRLTLMSPSIVPEGNLTLAFLSEDEENFFFLPCFFILASTLTTGNSIFALPLCPFFELELELELDFDFLWCFLCFLCLTSTSLFLKLRST